MPMSIADYNEIFNDTAKFMEFCPREIPLTKDGAFRFLKGETLFEITKYFIKVELGNPYAGVTGN